MADSTEVIQHKMEETRARLADNLDKLGQTTAGTVQEVATTVSETVGAVQETAQAVSETVTGVTRFFDIRRQAEENPWLTVGGAVAAGFVAGYLLTPSGSPSPPSRSSGSWIGEGNGHPSMDMSRMAEASERPLHKSTTSGWMEAAGSVGTDWLSGLAHRFGPALDKLKGMAIGAAMGIARDALTKSMASDLANPIKEVFNDMTKHLGGEPVASEGKPKGQDHDYQHSHTTEMDRPVGTGSRQG